VEPVANPVVTETGTEGLLAQILGDLGIERAAQFTERLDSAFLSHFHNNAGTGSHVLGDRNVFGEDSTVNFEEFLSSGLVQVKHLHGRDLEALLKDGVNSLSSEASSDDVGFNDNACAVGTNGSGRELLSVEEQLALAALGLDTGRHVHGIANSVRAEALANVLLNLFQCSESSLSNNFHASGDIRLQVSGGFSVSLSLTEGEELLSGGTSELAHREARDNETGAIHLINNFTSISVGIRLDQGESSLGVVSEMVAGAHISVVNNLELPGEDGNNRANIELVTGKVGALHTLKENLASFHIEHLNSIVPGVEGQEVLADERCSLIVPFSFKYKAFLG